MAKLVNFLILALALTACMRRSNKFSVKGDWISNSVYVDTAHLGKKSRYTNDKNRAVNVNGEKIKLDTVNNIESYRWRFYNCLMQRCFMFERKFDSSLDIRRCMLIGPEFSKCNFRNDLTIFSSEISEPNFFKTNFQGDVVFYKSILRNCTFDSDTFRNMLNFRDCKFVNNLQIKGQDFTNLSAIHFYGSQLPDTIELEDLKMGPVIDFREADFKSRSLKPIQLFMYNVDISKLRLDYEHFRVLFLGDATDDEKETFYEALFNNFKTNGQLESYESLDREYQEFKLKRHFYTYPFAWLNRVWWNYGYDKWRVFFWTLGFLLVFTPITYLKLDHFNRNVYAVDNTPRYIRRKERWWYSFIYTATIFFKLTLKLEKLKFEDKKWAIYIVVVYTAGIVCLAYIANFVLQR